MDYRRIQNETKEEEERLWAGSIGDRYNTRNLDTQDYYKRRGFWINLQLRYNLENVLEIGCNRGYNLEYIFLGDLIYGIDINRMAIADCHKEKPYLNTVQGSVFDLPFKDGWFSLCFTVGVLIHIPPAQLKDAMAEIVRCSGKYVLCAEYWAEEERERPFLDMIGVTWERPYDKLYMDMGLTLVESGELTKEQGFNELRYFLFKK
jgi:SAM-dependent methyltransferase